MPDSNVKSFAAHAKDAVWTKDLRPYFKYRDLGIKEATGGKVLAHIIRAAEPCGGPMGYHSHHLDFQMVYLIKGWARLYFEEIARVVAFLASAPCSYVFGSSIYMDGGERQARREES